MRAVLKCVGVLLAAFVVLVLLGLLGGVGSVEVSLVFVVALIVMFLVVRADRQRVHN